MFFVPADPTHPLKFHSKNSLFPLFTSLLEPVLGDEGESQIQLSPKQNPRFFTAPCVFDAFAFHRQGIKTKSQRQDTGTPPIDTFLVFSVPADPTHPL